MGTARQPRYDNAEFKQRGEALFDKEIRAQVEGRNPRHFIAIDIETGAFEIDENEFAACERLRERLPDAQIWLRRVGSPYARRFGGRLGKSES